MSYLRNQYGWHQSVDHMKVHFGLGAHAPWPAAGMSARVVDGVRLWVEPLQSKEERQFLWNGHRCHRNPHRLMAECPVCGKVTSYGRLHQHLRVHE